MTGRVGIVGAGISGLVLHRMLRQYGIETVVFEAHEDPGGVIRSRRIDGRVLESGPQRVRMTPTVAELVDDLALTDQVIVANDQPLFVYYDGTLCETPLSPRAALRTDLLSWWGKARVLLEPFVGGPPRAGETVAEYLERAFGTEFAARFAGPLYAGLYGSDPTMMPVEHSLMRAFDRMRIDGSVLRWAIRRQLRGRTPPPVISFVDGLQTLPARIVGCHPAGLRFGEPVTGIERTDRGYRLRTAAGIEPVDTVVLTVPAGTAAQLLEAVAPTASKALAQLTYHPLATVHLATTEWDRSGSGHTIPLSEGLLTRGVTWNGSLFGDLQDGSRMGIYTCFLGRAGRTSIETVSADELGRRARTEFETVTATDASIMNVDRMLPGMPAYDHTWNALEQVDLPDRLVLCTNYTDRAGIPGRIAAATELAATLAADKSINGYTRQPDPACRS